MQPNNLIIIKGGAHADVRRALKQWINLYLDKLPRSSIFKIFKNGRSSHIIQADARLDNTRFFFLVNYLKSPEYVHYTIDIEGFTTGNEDNILKNKSLQVYISDGDTEFDNVFVTTSENEHYKIGFNGVLENVIVTKLYQYPKDLDLHSPEIIDIEYSRARFTKEKELLDRINYRFNIGVLTAITIWIAVQLILIFKKDVQSYSYAINVYSHVMFMWFFIDYKMLRVSQIYLKSLAMAISLALFGFWAAKSVDIPMLQLLLVCTTTPLVFLFLQFILRHIFLNLTKVEPSTERNNSGVDFMYTMILIMGTIISAMCIAEHLKI